MADTKTETAGASPAQEPAPAGLKTVKAIAGNVSINDFAESMGVNLLKSSSDDTDEDEDGGEASGYTEVSGNEGIETPSDDDEGIEGASSDDDEGEDEDVEEDPESAKESDEDEVPKAKKGEKGIRAKTADGKDVTLPEDLVIQKKIDGEWVDIKLKDHLDVVAGEETVKQRLSKVASFYEDTKEFAKRVDRQRQDFKAEIEQFTKLVDAGKPEMALCLLADKQGVSPVGMYRKFLDNLAKAASEFQDMSPEQIESYFIKLENEWITGKEKKRQDEGKRQEFWNNYQANAIKEIKAAKLTDSEFSKAAQELQDAGEIDQKDPHGNLRRAIDRALEVKHDQMIEAALTELSPKLLSNKELVQLLRTETDARRFTKDEIKHVAREVVGHKLTSSLSKKARTTGVVAPTKKKNGDKRKDSGVRTFKSGSDLIGSFNL